MKKRGRKNQNGDFSSVDFEMPYGGTRIKFQVHKKSAELIDALLAEKRLYMLASIHDCESPIEQLFRISLDRETEYIPYLHDNVTIEIRNQAKIGDYRVDFLVQILRSIPSENEPYRIAEIVIECDGHDFHEKTKEQAAHDKARDRYIQSLGMAVLRFTGSEIWKDPKKCASEVSNLIRLKICG